MANPDYQNEMMGVQYEVPLKYQYIVSIQGIPTYLCIQAELPKWSAGQVQLNYINQIRWQAGKVRWQPITLTVIDAYTPSGAQAIMALLRAKHEPATGRDGYYNNYVRKQMSIHILGPSGDVQKSWKLHNAWLQSADFGQLQYADQNTPLQINLTIRYDWAQLEY